MGGPPASVPAARSSRACARVAATRPRRRRCACTISFVELPDGNYKPRAYDPRVGLHRRRRFVDYSAPLGEPQHVSATSRRHRLQKKDPKAADQRPGEADRLLPRPRRARAHPLGAARGRALVEPGVRGRGLPQRVPRGAAARRRQPDGHPLQRHQLGAPLDARLEHGRRGDRSAHGRDHQGRRHARLAARSAGLHDRRRPAVAVQDTATRRRRSSSEWALARIRQLSAHEVGHTLGLGHNYYDSTAGRISVMDYPHPLVTLKADGTIDFSKVYAAGIGEWDKVTINYGYQDFPAGTDEAKALASDPRRRVDEGPPLPHEPGHREPPARRSVVERHRRRPPNSTRMMEVRRVALSRFGENAIRLGEPLAHDRRSAACRSTCYHRYQVEAAASVLGGQHYIYAMRGDGRVPVHVGVGGRAARGARRADGRPSSRRRSRCPTTC